MPPVLGPSKAIETQGTYLTVDKAVTGSFAFVNGSPAADTITRAAGSFVTDGFLVGDVIRTSAAAGNAGPFTVTAVAANTLTINGPASNAGAATVTITIEQVVGEITNFDGPDGQAAVIDVSHLSSTRREKRMGLPDEGGISFEMNFVPDDRGQLYCRKARASRTKEKFRLYYSNGINSQRFEGFVSAVTGSGGVDDKVGSSLSLIITGEVELWNATERIDD